MNARSGLHTPARYIHPLSILLLAAVGIVVFAAEPGQAQSGAKIKDIHFIGNDAFSDGHLRDILKAEAGTGFSQILAEEDELLYDEEQMAGGLARLARFYQREGYLDVEIGTVKVDKFDRKKNEVELSVAIAEGIPIRISKLWHDISGVDEAERDRLLKVFTEFDEKHALHEGDRFRDSSLMIDRDTLNNMLSNNGYPYGDAKYELRLDTAQHSVEVIWRVQTGALVHFDSVIVRGNVRVGGEIIAEMAAFQPGQRYDRRLVDQTQEQVYGLGMFQVATVHPQLQDPQRTTVPVIVSVKEGPRYRLKVGVGYGREEDFRTFGDLRKFGLFGGARTLRLYVKHSDLEPYLVRLSATQPAFLHPRSTLTVSPYIWRQQEKAFDVRRIGGDIAYTHVFTEHLSGAATYTFERVKLEGEQPAARAGLDLPTESYTKSSIAVGGQFDNSEPLFSPARGIFAASNFTYSGLGFGSDFHFWKNISEVRHYREFSRWVVATRLKIGWAKEFSDDDVIPSEERLYSGGSNSVRGWARQELGPMVDDIPVGGRSLLEGSLELRYPFWGIISGAAFLDFGNVWLESFDYPLDDLRYAAGLGVRVTTPIGPIRLDIAQPIFDEEKTIQLHISVGQAF